jgi:hypothetical protein
MTPQALENQEPEPIPADQIATPVMPLAKRINVEALIGKIVNKEDFAEIEGKIEPTRDLALKLFAVYKLSYDTQLLSTTPMGSTILIAVKARVYQDRRAGKKVAEGLGGCTTEETKSSGKRAYHDALARAETRAFKRALEAAVGLPFINQIISRLFGGFEVEESRATGIAEDRLLRVLNAYIDGMVNVRQLENWGKKYKNLVELLSEESRQKLRQHYAARKARLKPKPVCEVRWPLVRVEQDRDLCRSRELSLSQRGEIERVLGEEVGRES